MSVIAILNDEAEKVIEKRDIVIKNKTMSPEWSVNFQVEEDELSPSMREYRITTTSFMCLFISGERSRKAKDTVKPKTHNNYPIRTVPLLVSFELNLALKGILSISIKHCIIY